jgi:hypothetical protein
MALPENLGDLPVSITNYAELQAAVADWLARPNDPAIAAVTADLIRLAEARITFGSGEAGTPLYAPPLRVRQMETRATVVLGAEYVSLPTDFLEMRELKINTDRERKLAYVTPQHFAEAAAAQLGGLPHVYTLVGSSLRLGPAPSGSPPLTAELLYYAKLPLLSDAAPTNWLLATAPNIYLFGALLEASAYIRDQAQLAQWSAAYGAATEALQAQDRRAKHGGAPLIMRPVAVTP